MMHTRTGQGRSKQDPGDRAGIRFFHSCAKPAPDLALCFPLSCFPYKGITFLSFYVAPQDVMRAAAEAVMAAEAAEAAEAAMAAEAARAVAEAAAARAGGLGKGWGTL